VISAEAPVTHGRRSVVPAGSAGVRRRQAFNGVQYRDQEPKGAASERCTAEVTFAGVAVAS
jgi:hypothetical protein